jgi:hypothetical protein
MFLAQFEKISWNSNAVELGAFSFKYAILTKMYGLLSKKNDKVLFLTKFYIYLVNQSG